MLYQILLVNCPKLKQSTTKKYALLPMVTLQSCSVQFKIGILGKDSCQSDSGGPVLWTDTTTNRMHLIGIISHGVGCDSDYPGINTRVTWFLDWIVSTTGKYKNIPQNWSI